MGAPLQRTLLGQKLLSVCVEMVLSKCSAGRAGECALVWRLLELAGTGSQVQ